MWHIVWIALECWNHFLQFSGPGAAHMDKWTNDFVRALCPKPEFDEFWIEKSIVFWVHWLNIVNMGIKRLAIQFWTKIWLQIWNPNVQLGHSDQKWPQTARCGQNWGILACSISLESLRTAEIKFYNFWSCRCPYGKVTKWFCLGWALCPKPGSCRHNCRHFGPFVTEGSCWVSGN